MRIATDQADLFAPAAPSAPSEAPAAPEHDVPPAFIEQQRAILLGMLDLARGAARLPWPDYTQSALAELRFEGLARWLPEPEATKLRAAFAAELDRLYAAEG